MTYYKCRRCGHQYKIFRDIKNHLNIKKSCITDFTCLKLTNDEIIIMSIIPYIDGEQNINYNYLKKYKHIYSNKNLLFDLLFNIDKNKIKICKYCNKSYDKIQDLKKHIIIECFEKEMCKICEGKTQSSIDKIDNNELHISSSICLEGNILNNNITNINNINNISNVNNIILDVNPSPIPFDDNWDISKISESEKSKLMISQIMYTHLLKEILKNNSNLNVIIDKDKDFGIVYKNDLEKYIKMEIKDIVHDSMEKLQNNLLSISDELKKNYFYDKYQLEYKDKDIKNKYKCFINNDVTNKMVNGYITDIFNNKKDDATNLMQNFLLTDKIKLSDKKNIGF